MRRVLVSIIFILIAYVSIGQVQTINIGTYPNDGKGDNLRDAFIKTNSNFSYLNSSILIINDSIEEVKNRISLIDEDGIFHFNRVALDNVSGINTGDQDLSDYEHKKLEVYLTFSSTINTGFTIKPTSMVWLNGVALPSDKWEGVGTTTLNILIPIKQYDYLTITK